MKFATLLIWLVAIVIPPATSNFINGHRRGSDNNRQNYRTLMRIRNQAALVDTGYYQGGEGRILRLREGSGMDSTLEDISVGSKRKGKGGKGSFFQTKYSGGKGGKKSKKSGKSGKKVKEDCIPDGHGITLYPKKRRCRTPERWDKRIPLKKRPPTQAPSPAPVAVPVTSNPVTNSPSLIMNESENEIDIGPEAEQVRATPREIIPDINAVNGNHTAPPENTTVIIPIQNSTTSSTMNPINSNSTTLEKNFSKHEDNDTRTERNSTIVKSNYTSTRDSNLEGKVTANLTLTASTQFPTKSPTLVSEATLSPSSAPTPKRIQHQIWIDTDAILFAAIGSTDLANFEVDFFELLERTLASFMKARIGPMLAKMELTVSFLPSSVATANFGLVGNIVSYKSYFEVSTRLELVSEDMEAMIEYNQYVTTSYVQNFFVGDSLRRFLALLDARNIKLTGINSITNLPMASQDKESALPFNGPETPISSENDQEGGKSLKSGLYAAIISLCVVLIAIIVVLFIFKRINKQIGKYDLDVLESDAGSIYSSDEHKIKPAAIQKKRKTERTTESKPVPSSRWSLGRHRFSNDARPKQVASSGLDMARESEHENVDRAHQDDLKDGHNNKIIPVESKTLTCLDGGNLSVDSLSKNYPEFDLFTNFSNTMSNITSPIWSVAGYSYETDEDYHSERQKWRDEVNGVSLPLIGTSRSDDDDNGSQKSYETPSIDLTEL